MRNLKPQYTFAVLSDIHIDLENHGENTYFIHAEENFSRALAIIKKRGCRFIVSAGDQITNASGTDEEWKRYNEIIEKSGYRGHILASMGNHETRCEKYGIGTIGDCHKAFIKGAGLIDLPINRTGGKTYYLYEDPDFTDIFLFLSLENGVDTNLIDNFTDEQMDWAERMVQEYEKKKRRIFLIQHAPLYGFGTGDNNRNPAYEGSIRLQDHDGTPFYNNRRFFRLIREHKSIIWLSGHTHVDFRDNVNYSNDDQRACHMLHIPALAGSTRIIGDGNGGNRLDRRFHPHTAQGYIAQVYADRTVFRAIDFYTDQFLTPYTYTVYR